MYIIDNGAMAIYKSGNRIPAKLSEQQNSEIQGSEASKAFIAQINNGEPMPTVSELGQLWGIHSNNIKSMFQGKLNPQETAENIVSQLKEAVELMNSGKQ
jgi:arabinogalactan oligomer/maltooligosaccharide transport system substrate-binding protein